MAGDEAAGDEGATMLVTLNQNPLVDVVWAADGADPPQDELDADDGFDGATRKRRVDNPEETRRLRLKLLADFQVGPYFQDNFVHNCQELIAKLLARGYDADEMASSFGTILSFGSTLDLAQMTLTMTANQLQVSELADGVCIGLGLQDLVHVLKGLAWQISTRRPLVKLLQRLAADVACVLRQLLDAGPTLLRLLSELVQKLLLVTPHTHADHLHLEGVAAILTKVQVMVQEAKRGEQNRMDTLQWVQRSGDHSMWSPGRWLLGTGRFNVDNKNKVRECLLFNDALYVQKGKRNDTLKVKFHISLNRRVQVFDLPDTEQHKDRLLFVTEKAEDGNQLSRLTILSGPNKPQWLQHLRPWVWTQDSFPLVACAKGAKTVACILCDKRACRCCFKGPERLVLVYIYIYIYR